MEPRKYILILGIAGAASKACMSVNATSFDFANVQGERMPANRNLVFRSNGFKASLALPVSGKFLDSKNCSSVI